MELREYVIPKAAVPLPGKSKDGTKPSFEVRGLCADDLTFLISLHHEPITRALKLYQESREDILATGRLNGFVLTLIKDFPALVAEVISAANDALDDETRAVVRKLPITTQLAAVTEIVRLTVEDAGGLKNLFAEMQAHLGVGVAGLSGTEQPAPQKTN
jgi:hypothetical protein